jgi:hypothetical protein
LLENPVSCTRISEEQHTTTGTNPQTLTVTPPTSQNTTVVVLPSDISPVPDTFGCKQQPTKHEYFQKGFAAILMSSPYKTNSKTTKRRKRTRDQRKSSKIQLQKRRQSGPSDENTSVIYNEHEMKTVIILRLRRF